MPMYSVNENKTYKYKHKHDHTQVLPIDIIHFGPSEMFALPLDIAFRMYWPLLTASFLSSSSSPVIFLLEWVDYVSVILQGF